MLSLVEIGARMWICIAYTQTHTQTDRQKLIFLFKMLVFFNDEGINFNKVTSIMKNEPEATTLHDHYYRLAYQIQELDNLNL